MEPFTAAPHHDILVLLVQVATLLFVARAFGEIAQRLGQPSVVGEILSGIVLGPSLLSGAVPAIGAWIVPQPGLSGYLLEVISLLGALFLLLLTGLETDLALIRRHARTALGVSFGGIVITFSSGYVLGWSLPDRLLADPGQRMVFALFVATAMSISAIPVIAKVLMDLNLMRRDVGQTIIAAGMSDDTIGWILLSIVAGLASEGEVTSGTVIGAVGRVAIFLILSFTVGRWLVKRLVDFVQDEVRSSERLLTLVIALTLGWGAVTQALSLEAVLGAFVIGIVLGQMPRLPQNVHRGVESLAIAVFTPVFFATAGLKVNARALFEPTLFGYTLLVIFVATAGKVVGTYLGARLIGRARHWTALSFGAGLNARGAMEIIIATIGLELGILSQEMFSIVVVMAMATSLMAPPAMRWVLAHIQPEPQELERLRREELAVGNVAAHIHRVLIPVRLRPIEGDSVHTIESFVIGRLAEQAPISVTLFNAAESGAKERGTRFLESLAQAFPTPDLTRKVVEGRDPIPAILEEAQKDYDLLMMGASERSQPGGAVFHPMVDQIVRMAPCSTLVVKGRQGGEDWRPRRILVPSNGSLAARRAAELAFRLTAEGEEIMILSVVQPNPSPYRFGGERGTDRDFDRARELVRELCTLGQTAGAVVRGEVREGPTPEDVILQVSVEEQMDLIVLGTDVRPASDRLFLGPRVERLLEEAPCPTLVFNAS
ncbi:MAG TPA: cation:proton antiporter [Longimicrobiaceae bacterium]|nr:cation:proton antiporter [Longimicrobiaceae bacterium]